MGLWCRLGVESLLFWHWRMFVLFWGALPCNEGSASCASRLCRLMIFLRDGAGFYLTKVRKSAGKIFLWGF